MTEKERVLNIVCCYLQNSGKIINDVDEFSEFDENLPTLIKGQWGSLVDFFNDLAEHALKSPMEGRKGANKENL